MRNHLRLIRMLAGTVTTVLIILVGGCRPPDEDVPTLIASLAPPTSVPVTSTATIPTMTPTRLLVPLPILSTDTPMRPTVVLSSPEPIPPPLIVTANGTLTITLTEAQLNEALTERYAAQPITGYAGPPRATLGAGSVALTLTLVTTAAASTTSLQTATLTLTLSALPTVSGTVLDVRAVKLIKPDQVSTLQVKPAQALLAATLNALAARAAGLPTAVPLDIGEVIVSSDKLTLTVLLS